MGQDSKYFNPRHPWDLLFIPPCGMASFYLLAATTAASPMLYCPLSSAMTACFWTTEASCPSDAPRRQATRANILLLCLCVEGDSELTFFLVLVLVFQDRVFLYSPGCP